VRIRCDGVGENIVFSGDYKGSMQKFWEEDDINRLGITRKKFAICTVDISPIISKFESSVCDAATQEPFVIIAPILQYLWNGAR